MLKIGNIKLDKPFFLAPMAGVTDKPFRTICKQFGANFMYTEFVSSEGIIRNNKKTIDYMKFDDFERPFGIQIFGNKVDSMVKASQIIEEKMKPDLIDLNFGCPVKKVVSKGAGASLLKNIDLMIEMAEEIVNNTNLPITAKIRSGWDKSNINALEIARRLETTGIKALTIHPRTAKMLYSGKADWNIISEIKNVIKIPVIGNGDVKNSSDAVKMFNETNCDGIMIGRGALGNPWIFKDMNENISFGNNKIELRNEKNTVPSYQEIFSIMIRHLKLIEKNIQKDSTQHF